jgi:hypothetical protein
MILATVVLLLAACSGAPVDSKPPSDTSSTPTDCDAVWYADLDGDGFGDPTLAVTACEPPGDQVADGTDCDDANALAHPGAEEICTTPFDADCDGAFSFLDADLDGTAACEDCDDANPSVHPGAAEFCDGADSDCDGVVDDAPVDGRVYYRDADGDGFGDVASGAEACDAPADGTTDARDCDDADPEVSPTATETCDGVDNDCDGTVDGALAIDAVIWWDDADGDGWGDGPTQSAGCEAPTGSVDVPGDCDDLEPEVNPDAPETCNGVDDDCSGVVDGADVTDATTWYADRDADGWGNDTSTVAACDAPADHVASGGDCDDTDATVAPDLDEVCDDQDNDCDGGVDEADAVGAPTWYADTDGDLYGDSAVAATACAAPAGFVARWGDCDDTADDVSPAGVETCDTRDEDCDGEVDEDSAVDAILWYVDADADAYGDPTVTHAACAAPSGFVGNATDCDDGDDAVSPGSTELCNSVDDDCDATVDEATAADATTWYADTDVDGYGDPSVVTVACTAPAETVSDGTDCDDGDPAFHPGASESDCADPNDYNCDGSVGLTDADLDGWEACADCDDGSADVAPGAAELCNLVDDDCDGVVDGAGAVGAGTWYQDADGDGYGTSTSVDHACALPVGFVTNASDCDDALAAVSPSGTELCATPYDDDCDGDTSERRTPDCTRYYLDFDEDSFGSSSSICACAAEDLFTADDADDCDDGDAAVNPDAVEDTSNGIDDDCDGTVDSSLLADAPLAAYGDNDNDNAGGAVALGDVDGDGWVDLLMGAYGADTAADNAGAAYLILGGTTGEVTASNADAVLLGTAVDGDAAGYSVAVGDIDADGYGDLLVGAYGNQTGGRDAGAAYVLYGPVLGSVDLAASTGLLWGVARSDHAGVDVAVLGDTDGDTVSEVAVGATGVDAAASAAGAVYIFGGGPTGSLSMASADAEITGEDTSDTLGGDIAGGADTNGDGLADMILGCANDDVSGAGTVFVFEGPLTSGAASAVAAALLTGVTANDAAGSGVDFAGDLDGDGYEDVVIGASEASSGGRIYLVYGPFSGTTSLSGADATLDAPAAAEAGRAVAGVGDIGGDGVPDVLIGGYEDATIGADAGAAWVVSGAFTGTGTLPEDAVGTWFGGAGDTAGVAVGGGGDFDGDGVWDMVVGAQNADPDGVEVGGAFLIW